MKKICIFAGTTEGRELIHFLEEFTEEFLKITVYVATEYGEIINNSPHIQIKAGRMSLSDMKSQLSAYTLVIDCTHPYATAVTEQLVQVCHELSVPYLRIKREESSYSSIEKVHCVENLQEMITYLEHSSGNILSTLGAKELIHFKDCNFINRLYARVLPLSSSLEACANIGLPPSQIIAMQGPFSYGMNRSTIESYNINTFLTKDSGKVGGIQEKFDVCKDLSVDLLLLKKPEDVEGYTLHQGKNVILSMLQLKKKSVTQCLSILSCGMGAEVIFSQEGRIALENADVLLGSQRLLQLFPESRQEKYPLYTGEKIQQFAKEHPEFENICLLVTGDAGFFSTAKNVAACWEGDISFFSGISSISYLSARFGISWEDCKILSLHGRKENILEYIKRNEKIFILFGGEDTPSSVARLCHEYGFDVQFYIGENLSYPNEKLTISSVKDTISLETANLCCAFVIHSQAENTISFGLPDTAFQRVEGVPMTKSEVRTITLSKLQLRQDSVIYDIGAGTGSVSVEMAQLSPFGRVFALEQKESALDILEKNKKSFKLSNLEIISGDARKGIQGLPAPSHVFIGGFSGDLKQLLEEIKIKNPKSRVAINTVTLDTLAQVTALLPSCSYSEVVEIGISRGETRGKYRMMLANNPVFVITLEF